MFSLSRRSTASLQVKLAWATNTCCHKPDQSLLSQTTAFVCLRQTNNFQRPSPEASTHTLSSPRQAHTLLRKHCITVRSFSAVGLFFGFLVRDTLTKLWKLVDLEEDTDWFLMSQELLLGILLTHHLFLSFSLGGWKLLFDIRNNALKKTEEGFRGAMRQQDSGKSLLEVIPDRDLIG